MAHPMGHASNVKPIRKAVRREVQEAEAHLLLKLSRIILGRGFIGRLRWLLTGK
jgi:hypothetical protein